MNGGELCHQRHLRSGGVTSYNSNREGRSAFTIKPHQSKDRLDLKKLVDSSFKKYFNLIRPVQQKDEILGLLKYLSEYDLNNILEIGTAKGGTLFLFSKIASEMSTLISVDLPNGKFGGSYPFWMIPLFKSFALPNQKIHLVRTDSHRTKTLIKVKDILGGNELDFLFIDGDHSYNGVSRDFEMYSPLVKKNGVIAFHDIVPGPEIYVGGVPKYWSEIKSKYEHHEFFDDWDQNGAGIGLIIKR